MTRISVVVPTLDEEREVVATLDRARAAFGPDAELIVADGGSRDRTVELAGPRARIVQAEGGRGAQLAAGIAAGRGDLFVLLHADAWPAPDAGRAILAAVRRGVPAGCLTLRFRRPAGAGLRLLERGIAIRTRTFRTATGDQAIFATRHALEAAGGLRPLPLFEDVSLVRALRRRVPFAPLGATVTVSGRRWRERGLVRTVALHALLRLAFALGADPRALDRVYRRRSPGPGHRGGAAKRADAPR